MRFHTPSLLAASCLFFSHSVEADTIIFKDGKRLEGRVLREVDGNYIVEVSVTPTIKDEKTIPRKEVERIEKEAEDQKAFNSMANYVPTPDLLSDKEYMERMDRLEAFLKLYPNSRYERKVKQMLDLLGAELDVVSLGGVKLDGAMISPERYNANAYEYDAKVAEKKIKDVVTRREYLTALRMYSKYEVNFPQAEGRAALKPVIKQALIGYRVIVMEYLNSLDRRIAERSKGLFTMTMEDRMKSEQAIKEQTETITRRVAEEKAAKVDWITPDAFHKESLNMALTQILAMKAKLEIAAPDNGISFAEIYRDAWINLAEGTDQEKMEVLESAEDSKLPKPYLDKLRERAALTKVE